MDIRLFRKTKPLGDSESDFIMTERAVDAGKMRMVNFVVLQLHERGGEILEIKKHDCSHTGYNVHRYYEDLKHRQEMPEEPLLDGLYWRCKKDILENWKEHKAKYLQKHFKE